MSCNRAPVTNPPDLPAEAAKDETPEEAAPAEAEKSPSQVLSELHHTDVEVDDSISMPDGFIVAYTYGRIAAQLGELREDGIDLKAEIDEETARCESERAAMEEGEREWVEMEGRTCEEEALASVLDDEGASMECESFGLAYFDLQGALLHDEEGPDECVAGVVAFDLETMPGNDTPVLLVVTSIGNYGHYTRGGWGFVKEWEQLEIMQPRFEDDGFFLPLVEAELNAEEDGGNCSSGVHAGYVFSEEGHLDVYRQDWDDCEQEECMMELEEASEDGDYDEAECEPPIEVERNEWDPKEAEFLGWEDKDEEDPVIPSNVHK